MAEYRPLSPALFGRLTLIRDLATRGFALLAGNPNPFDGTQGLVLLDLSIETCLKTAVVELGRSTERDSFKGLLDALGSEGQHHRQDIIALHDLRNAAQHRGVPPRANECAWARRIGADALRALFPHAGADFDTLSSVHQIESPHLREPLATALALCDAKPADAAALAACAMERLRGWVAQFTGEALIPDDMWVFQTPLWNDTSISVACADKRDEFLHAMLTVAAGAAMGIEAPALLRFSRLAHGHHARRDNTELTRFSVTHTESAVAPSAGDAAWMIELVSRTAVRFEGEWPDLVLVHRSAERDT
jgi:hypothetical protein